MEDIDWTSLPEHIWTQILNNLDVKSLLSATEVCKTFAANFNSTSKLNRKVCFVLDGTRFVEQNFDSSLHVLQQSKRKYKSVKCDWLPDHIHHYFPSKAKMHSIRFLFENVEIIRFTSGVFSLGLFDGSTKLQQLKIDLVFLEQEESLRLLLINKPNLKTLHINGSWACMSGGRADGRDFHLPKIESTFQLEDLNLIRIDIRSAASFLMSQQRLKKISLFLNGSSSIRDIEPLFKSKDLHTVKIGITRADSLNGNFLPDETCPSVVNFEIDNRNHNLDVLGKFAAVLPNVKNFTLNNATPFNIAQLSCAPWYQLESLKIGTKLENLKALTIRSRNFNSLEYRINFAERTDLHFLRNFGMNFGMNFGDFLARHQTIRQLKLRGTKHKIIYQQQIKQMIAEALPLLDTLEILVV